MMLLQQFVFTMNLHRYGDGGVFGLAGEGDGMGSTGVVGVSVALAGEVAGGVVGGDSGWAGSAAGAGAAGGVAGAGGAKRSSH